MNKDSTKNVNPTKPTLAIQQIIPSANKPNNLTQIFKKDSIPLNQKPIAKLKDLVLTVDVPLSNYEIISQSYDNEDGNNILYIWKEALGNKNHLIIRTDPRSPKAYFDIQLPGLYSIKHVVKDKGNKLDSIQFTIIATKPAIEINYSPIAKINIVGAQLSIQKDNLPLVLNSGSIDPEGDALTYNWTIISGFPGDIESKNSSRTRILNLTEGPYTFKLDIIDSKGHSSTEIINIIVTPESSLVANTKLATENKAPLNPISSTSTAKNPEKIPGLKGGPEYALFDLVLPGVGHYYASGDYTGYGRKKTHFFTTALVSIMVASGFYLKLDSERDFTKYKSFEIEYQKNDLGVLTGGQRGGIEAEAQKFYDRARQKDLLFKGLIIGSGVIIAGDAILTLFKGLKNKNEYNRRYKLGKFSLNIDPFSNQYSGMVGFNLNK
ncbi:MAG: hypothetical protein IPJ09_09295 [Saprospiraceae bacterium]|nr:hypothetical protein [Saprospiraceae bacterium]